MGDGHLEPHNGYVGISQRKLEGTAWLCDLLDEVFPRWWFRSADAIDERGITFKFVIRCPPLYEWLRLMAVGPAGYNPLDPMQLRKYPHFDRHEGVVRGEAESAYGARTTAHKWTEEVMRASFTRGSTRRPCCVCGHAKGVRVICSGRHCHLVEDITRGHPACIGRTDEEAFSRKTTTAGGRVKNKPWPWFCPHAECQEEAAQWAAAHSFTSAQRRRGSEPILPLLPQLLAADEVAREEEEEEEDEQQVQDEDEDDDEEGRTDSVPSLPSSGSVLSAGLGAAQPGRTSSPRSRTVSAASSFEQSVNKRRRSSSTVPMCGQCDRPVGDCDCDCWVLDGGEPGDTALGADAYTALEHQDGPLEEEEATSTPMEECVGTPTMQVAGVASVVWNGGVWDIDADGHWYYRKRWLGPDVASSFANVSQSQAVALLEGFHLADGLWNAVHINEHGRPVGRWQCTHSSMPLIHHLQLIGQLAGARVDLWRHSKQGKQNKGSGGRTLTNAVDHWALTLHFDKVYGAKDVSVSQIAEPVDVFNDVAARGYYQYEDDGFVYDLSVADNPNFLTQRLSCKRIQSVTDGIANLDVRAHPVYVGNCVKAMMFIYQTLGVKCLPFLPYVLPCVLAQIRTCDVGSREGFLQHLVGLVAIVRSHIKPWVDEMMAVCLEYWGDGQLIATILSLIEHLALSLRGDFQPQLSVLIPKFVSLLQESSSGPIIRLLHALQVMCTAGCYADSLHVLLPCLVRLCEQYELSEDIRVESVEALATIASMHSITDHASRLIHPFARMLVASSPALTDSIMRVLCILIQQLGYGFLVFEPMISSLVRRVEGRETVRYRGLVGRLFDSVKGVREKRGMTGGDVMDVHLSFPMEEWKMEDLSPPPPPVPAAAAEEKEAPPPIKKLHISQPNLMRGQASSATRRRFPPHHPVPPLTFFALSCGAVCSVGRVAAFDKGRLGGVDARLLHRAAQGVTLLLPPRLQCPGAEVPSPGPRAVQRRLSVLLDGAVRLVPGRPDPLPRDHLPLP